MLYSNTLYCIPIPYTLFPIPDTLFQYPILYSNTLYCIPIPYTLLQYPILYSQYTTPETLNHGMILASGEQMYGKSTKDKYRINED